MNSPNPPSKLALLAALACVGAYGVACGTPEVAPADAESGADAVDDSAADTGDAAQTDAADDVGTDVAPDGPIVCGSLPAPDGCPCSANSDCHSEFCLETPNGARCALPCTSDCPLGFSCTELSKSGGGKAKMCESNFALLCNPCQDNASCQSVVGAAAKCIKSKDGGAFCGVGCSGNDACPPGYSCEDAQDVGGSTSKQCVYSGPESCACSQTAISEKLSTPCTIVAGLSACAGKRSCGPISKDAPTGLSVCTADGLIQELCDGKDNDCDGQTDENTCDDNQLCTNDACDNAVCAHTYNTLGCEADGSSCTVGDHCSGGVCTPGAMMDCDDKNLCTTDSCDKIQGCIHLPADGTPCDADGNPCTEGDACSGGSCVAGGPKACASADPCVTSACEAGSGKCVGAPKDGAACSDGNPCTTDESCKGGKCAGILGLCDDLNSCTVDVCDAKIGCLHQVASGPCDDSDACTVLDSCSGKKCVGIAIDPTTCVDGNVCTSDDCDSKLGCNHAPSNGFNCSDGDDCTLGDTCQGGKCSGSSNVCACNTTDDCLQYDDGNPCNGVLYCDKQGPAPGCKMNPTTVINCDTSGNTACASNGCDPKTAKCVVTWKQDGILCDADGNLCTQGDSCKSGFCAPGLAPDCDDGNPCTSDACSAKIGCTHTANDNPCKYYDSACYVGDHCVSGICVGGTKKICNDGNNCTSDECDSGSGECSFTGDAISCSDNDLCTIGDVCVLGASTWSCQSGTPAICDDANPCTVDACVPATGCTFAVTSGEVPCYTGTIGTKDVGICHAGSMTCGKDGALGQCSGDQIPEASDVCDAKDNDCDGITDNGCTAASFSARFGSIAIEGISGSNKRVSAGVGMSWVGGGAAPGSGKGTGICLGSIPFLKGVNLCW